MAEIVGDTRWFPPTDLVDIDPKVLSTQITDDFDIQSVEHDNNKTIVHPRLGKDVAQVQAVQTAWRAEVSERRKSESSYLSSVGSTIKYKCKARDDDDDGETVFHGYITQPSTILSATATTTTTTTTTTNQTPTKKAKTSSNSDVKSPTAAAATTTPHLPGIIFFHTGAGPQDLFLRWKADSLATDCDLFDNPNNNGRGCVVLIADIISDKRGWGWDNDKTHYGNVRKDLLSYDEHGVKSKLRRRILAAISVMQSIPYVDKTKLAAFGWCLGGQVIAELGLMQHPNIKAIASFHGVFDGIRTNRHEKEENEQNIPNTPPSGPEALICHGQCDPYVPKSDVSKALSIFTNAGIKYTLHEFENIRHGFTSPAQTFNPNPNFQYDENAASESWMACRSLLKRAFAS